MYYTPEEWLAAEDAAKDILSTEYACGRLDIPEPVDLNIKKLAVQVAKAVIKTANHHQGSEAYYTSPI